ncbi:MAG: TIGR03790 family protein, partial [Acidobacteriota bacterium]|nr:TIGR03790 family protein [Acidobacteriota bacterium]
MTFSRISKLVLLMVAAQTAFAQLAFNDRVLVVYNAGNSESRSVAEYYIGKRSIPPSNICKIKPSSTDFLEEGEFRKSVKAPIQACLNQIGKDRILYIVFSYETPFDLSVKGQTYALDQFVADIWDDFLPDRAAEQTEVQPYFGRAQSEGNIYEPYVPLSEYRKKSGSRQLYSVWRLDAPTAALAKGLVDKALFAESRGLSGQACFDRRYGAIASVADYSYGAGDWDVFQAGEFARKAGFKILEDTHEQEFGAAPAPMRCDSAALYAGWYSLDHYNDAFSWNPGALGIHLDSASASNPRGGSNWAANAVTRGITVTSGAIGEPYLENLPHPDQAFLYLFQGANVGDALLRSTRLLKWRIINIGDPLYRPFPNGVHPTAPMGPEVVLGLKPLLTLGNMQAVAVVGLNGPAPPGGIEFAIKASRPDLVEVPQTVTLPEKAHNITFPINTKVIQDDATTIQ